MKPLYEKIAGDLEQRRRTLSAPLALPGEFELAREFGTSRETIRRALKRLEEQGALTRRRGVGSYLQPSLPTPGRLKGETVGVVPPGWMDESGAWYSSVIYEGISRWADANDCHFTILHTGRRAEKTHQWLEGVRKLGLAGMIWIHPQTVQHDLLRTAARLVPTVVLGRILPGETLHQIVPDYGAMASLLDAHLVRNGRSTYAVIGKNVYDPLSQTWIESVREAQQQRGAIFQPALHHFDYQCFHLTQLADLLLDFYLKARPEVEALLFPSSGSLQTLLANNRFRDAVAQGLAIVTTNYGPYPIETLLPGHTLTHVQCDWSLMAFKAMGLLAQVVSGHQVPKLMMEPVRLVEGHTVSPLPA